MMYSPPICAGYLVETVEPAPVGRSDIKIDKREYGVKTFPIVGIGASADGGETGETDPCRECRCLAKIGAAARVRR